MFAYSNQPFVTRIQFCGNPRYLVCDGRCDKAWGWNHRPFIRKSDAEDDITWLSDDELPAAPEDPGTWEGGDRKPQLREGHNKWCARECERSSMVDCKDFAAGRVDNIKGG